MKVSDLRQHLADLAKMLAVAEAKTVANDLRTISDGLAPFDGLALKDFAAFLVKAEAYSRGELPIKQPTKGRTKTTPAAKLSAEERESIFREVRDLYNNAAHPSITDGAIEAAIGRLSTLSKDDLMALGAALELKLVKSKTIPKMIAEINQRITARRGSNKRAGMLDGPTPNIVNVGTPSEG